MGGLAGVILSRRARDERELRAIGNLFRSLLVYSEHRGPHATGVALVNSNGDYYISKAPVSASQFVTGSGYRLILCRLDSETTCLMGHTRWPTRGTHLDNINNHPLVSDDGIRAKEGMSNPGVCVLIHNGHISNADSLFRAMGLRRETRVDSEILLRMAEKNLTISGIEPLGFVDDISRCKGKLSAVVVATIDPTKILLVKGNQPLEVRHHESRGLIVCASEPEILTAAIGLESGWTAIEIPDWRLVRVDTRQLLPLRAYLIPRGRTDEDGRPYPCR